jgi:hypothetical protein
MEDTLLLSGRAWTAYEINLSTSDNPDLVAVDALIAATNVSEGDRQPSQSAYD